MTIRVDRSQSPPIGGDTLASQDRSELGYLHTQLTNAAQKGLALLEENRAQVAACQALEYERDNYRIELDATRDRVRQVEEEKGQVRPDPARFDHI